jgi:hypothetical protein
MPASLCNAAINSRFMLLLEAVRRDFVTPKKRCLMECKFQLRIPNTPVKISVIREWVKGGGGVRGEGIGFSCLNI